MCPKLTRTYYVRRGQDPIISFLMTFQRIYYFNKRNTTGATIGTGSIYPSEAPECE